MSQTKWVWITTAPVPIAEILWSRSRLPELKCQNFLKIGDGYVRSQLLIRWAVWTMDLLFYYLPVTKDICDKNYTYMYKCLSKVNSSLYIIFINTCICSCMTMAFSLDFDSVKNIAHNNYIPSYQVWSLSCTVMKIIIKNKYAQT